MSELVEVMNKFLILWSGMGNKDGHPLRSKQALHKLVDRVNGIILHPGTKAGQAAARAGMLSDCEWEPFKKNFWNGVSAELAELLRSRGASRIYIAMAKNATQLVHSILYNTESVYLGDELRRHPEWHPQLTLLDATEGGGCGGGAELLLAQLNAQSGRSLALRCIDCTRYGTLAECSGGETQELQPMDRAAHCDRTYIGDRDRYGRKAGAGSCSYAPGESYEGDWRGGKMNGRGIYKWATGKSEEGEYRNGKPVGAHIARYPDGRVSTFQYR